MTKYKDEKQKWIVRICKGNEILWIHDIKTEQKEGTPWNLISGVVFSTKMDEAKMFTLPVYAWRAAHLAERQLKHLRGQHYADNGGKDNEIAKNIYTVSVEISEGIIYD